VPETKELEIQLDGRGIAELELLARQEGIPPEELAARIINKALDRMTRPPKSRSNVASLGRKG
jgi:hypothetical protein